MSVRLYNTIGGNVLGIVLTKGFIIVILEAQLVKSINFMFRVIEFDLNCVTIQVSVPAYSNRFNVSRSTRDKILFCGISQFGLAKLRNPTREISREKTLSQDNPFIRGTPAQLQ